MSKKTLTEKISNIIEREKIKPTPRSVFVAQRIFIWFILGLSIFVSAATLSMIVFRASRLRMLPYENLPAPAPNQFFDIVPIVFLITLIVALIIAVYEFGETNRGYKFEKIKVGLALIGCVAVLGSFFSYIGIHHFLHRFIVEQVKLAPTVEQIKSKRFDNPDRGIIRGVVIGQTLTNKSGKEINLIQGENIDVKDFLNIGDLEQPVILFGKIVPDGFIVCELPRPEKKVRLDSQKKPPRQDIRNCKRAQK